MNNLEKIIAQIENEALEKANSIEAQAKEEALEIEKSAKEEIAAYKETLKEETEKKLKTIYEGALNSSLQATKQQSLYAKQQAINACIEKAKEQLLNLTDEEYFAVLEKMLKAFAHKNEKGIIAFNEKDSLRVCEDLYKGYNLEKADENINIEGGFKLIYGGIEENCSFEAIILAKREELSDKAASLLFTSTGGGLV